MVVALNCISHAGVVVTATALSIGSHVAVVAVSGIGQAGAVVTMRRTGHVTVVDLSIVDQVVVVDERITGHVAVSAVDETRVVAVGAVDETRVVAVGAVDGTAVVTLTTDSHVTSVVVVEVTSVQIWIRFLVKGTTACRDLRRHVPLCVGDLA
jgi:hypothetical protein